jgi:hypothetical protein
MRCADDLAEAEILGLCPPTGRFVPIKIAKPILRLIHAEPDASIKTL